MSDASFLAAMAHNQRYERTGAEIRLTITDDMDVAQYNGQTSRVTSMAVKIAEAEALLERASEIVALHARLLGYGEECKKAKEWLLKLKDYAEEDRACMITGKGWRE